MRLALILAFLLAPVAAKSWSKAHEIGYRLPASWKVVTKDKGPQVFVAHGPRGGKGIARAALQVVGPVGGQPMEVWQKRVERELAKRTGWTVTARVPKHVGPYPAVRYGIRFVDGDAKGRARATLIALDDRYVILELSSAARSFPGGLYDRLEASLELKRNAHAFGGWSLDAPASWRRMKEPGLVLRGPAIGKQPWMVTIVPAEGELQGPEGSAAGPKVKWLGKSHPTLVAERDQEGETARMLVSRAGSWRVVVLMPKASWDAFFPVVEAMLSTWKKAKK